MTDRIGDVHISRAGFVATVTIDRPPINAVSVDLMRDLADVLEALDKDGATRAVVLATAGKVFCSGADLSNRTSEGPIPERSINPLYDQAVRLFSTELPIVVAVQGAAIGAGLGLAMIGDFRVAAPEARFAANFTKLGFHPGFGLTYTLPRLIGRQNASMMFLSGDRYDGSEALEMGLVDDLVDLSRLAGRAQSMAATIAENAPLAIRSTRKTLRGDLPAGVRAATEHEFTEQQWLMKTEDFKEGVRAVSERRAGDFKGK